MERKETSHTKILVMMARLFFSFFLCFQGSFFFSFYFVSFFFYIYKYDFHDKGPKAQTLLWTTKSHQIIVIINTGLVTTAFIFYFFFKYSPKIKKEIMFKDMFFNYNSFKKWDFCFLYFRNFLFLKIFMHSPGEKKNQKTD